MAALSTLAQPTPAPSRQAAGMPVAQASYQFCGLEATQIRLSKLSFVLDYGPKSNTLKRTETQVYDEQWQADGLASLADALNLMTAKGYDSVSSNAVPLENGITRYQYIFRRPNIQ
ncbi:MAG: hypothetical protein ACRYG7_02525 [Janthinobacterium lividum]